MTPPESQIQKVSPPGDIIEMKLDITESYIYESIND